MSDDKVNRLLRQSALEIQRLRDLLHKAESALSEPVAILGVGLRMPGGAADLDGLWKVLTAERDAIGPMPAERFHRAALSDPAQSVLEAAFLGDVASFDPAFFGISPREARQIDPQHRLLLETAWEALERAG